MLQAIIFDWVGTLYQRKTGLFPEVKEVLENLEKNYKLGLVSKGDKPLKRLEEIEQTGIANYFSSIVLAKRKTPKEFRKCLGELEINPENALVVGDRTRREIKIGNQLGCKTFWICKGEYSLEVPTEKTGQPTYTGSSIEDLLKLLPLL
jgi:putative hydrolase of the HAD superfamily